MPSRTGYLRPQLGQAISFGRARSGPWHTGQARSASAAAEMGWGSGGIPPFYGLLCTGMGAVRARPFNRSAMLRVGLTGGVGSGKSAVALVWAEAGVPVLQADALGRAMMEPGEPVYHAIVEQFGAGVVEPGGQLDRAALAREAFAGGRLAELNAIVHPAVIAAQDRELDRLEAEGRERIAAVESALILEASGELPGPRGQAPATAPGWRRRFGVLVLVAAPEDVRVERFVLRVGGPDASEAERDRLREDARRRMAAQLPEASKRPRCDYVIENTRTLVLLRREALRVLAALRERAESGPRMPPSR